MSLGTHTLCCICLSWWSFGLESRVVIKIDSHFFKSANFQLQDLADANLETLMQSAWRWVNLCGFQAVLKNVNLVVKCFIGVYSTKMTFSRKAWQLATDNDTDWTSCMPFALIFPELNGLNLVLFSKWKISGFGKMKFFESSNFQFFVDKVF